MDVVDRLVSLGLTEETAHEDFFAGSTLEDRAAEQTAMLVLLLSSERGNLDDIPLTEMQKRLNILRNRGVNITIDTLVRGIQTLVPTGCLDMREEGFTLFLRATPLLLDSIDPPHDRLI